MKKNKKIPILLIMIGVIVMMLVVKYSSNNESVEKISNTVIIEESENDTKIAALTFDDGPSDVYTEEILDGLKERGVKASFFLIGKNIEGREDLVKRMDEEGHLIGNHTYDHVQLSKLSKKDALVEINKCSRIIHQITGKQVNYIRPPFGAWNNKLDKATNLKVAMWDVDPRDWCTFDTQCIVRHIAAHVEDGYIILMHDGYETSVEAALQTVDQLKSQGYEFVTLDELVE